MQNNLTLSSSPLTVNFRSKRDYDVKKAEYDTEVNTARAEAELAYDLQVIWPICMSAKRWQDF